MIIAPSKTREVTKPSAKASCWRLTHREEGEGSADAGQGDDRLDEAAPARPVSPPELRM